MQPTNRRSNRSNTAVEFRDVSRRFTLYHEHRNSFQDWFIGLVRPRGHAEDFWALHDVSFSVGWGEALGVLGRNGAGKSTLLKLVTRILEPTSGEISLYGDTHAMLELGAGFHPELSGRDNIFLNGSIYGHDRNTMKERIEQIVAFAELEQFIDTPVKHYSSGMFMRLGFSIAVHMDPEILVVDEVLAVGDANFQAKSHRALHQLRDQGTTILFVSHNAEQVRSFCDRAILLEHGQLVDSGQVDDVVDHYERMLAASADNVELLRLRVLDERSGTATCIRPGDDIDAEVLLRIPVSGIPPDIKLGLDLYDESGAHLFGNSAPLPEDLPVESVQSGDLATVRGLVRQLPLRSGEVTVVASLQRSNGDNQILARQETTVQVRPEGVDPHRGILYLDHEWRWSLDGHESSERVESRKGRGR